MRSVTRHTRPLPRVAPRARRRGPARTAAAPRGFGAAAGPGSGEMCQIEYRLVGSGVGTRPFFFKVFFKHFKVFGSEKFKVFFKVFLGC